MKFEASKKMLRHLGRKLLAKPPFAEQVDLQGKKIIVTGASPGSIGFETAQTLASWGATVCITTRTKPNETAEALRRNVVAQGKQCSIDSHSLDLTQADSVIDFVNWYGSTHEEQLDVLVNNAGIHLDLLSQWKEPKLTDDGKEIHWRTNYLGTAQLNQLLLPLLKKTGELSGDARIINVVSHLHTKGTNQQLFVGAQPYNSWVAYGLSKLALIHNAFEIQRRFSSHHNLKSVALHPGSIASNIAHRGLDGHPLLQIFRRVFAPIERLILLTSEEGAQTQIHCATSPDLHGGEYYERCRPSLASADTKDKSVSERLWNDTQSWLKG